MLCDEEQEPEIRQVCVNFVKRLIMQLRERLPDNFNILKKVNMFAVDNILRPHKNIFDFINIFEYFKITDIGKLKSQLDKIHLIKWEKTEESMQFWAEVLAYRDAENNNPFKALALFAIQLFSLPWSNAEVERVFSQMNILKSKLPNKMALKSLNVILSIRYGLRRHNECCHTYSLPQKYLAQIKNKDKYLNDGENDDIESLLTCLI
ncbi:uncharacterized protein LOC117565073 [Drosophila albomicans]|uniref:Uncharacterized protein LOC117565073 n=1 Tax=Drosophila albomicans TaxID=7291 RepID=A0A9C6T1Z1_DROAB|nr:uncharacterized protein LOC117565073 [Drosophila albomicans]